MPFSRLLSNTMENVTTGFDIDEKRFCWKIENFHFLCKHKTLMEDQVYELKMGKLHFPTTWKLTFHKERDDLVSHGYGINFQLQEKPSTVERIVASFSLQVVNQGKVVEEVSKGPMQVFVNTKYNGSDDPRSNVFIVFRCANSQLVREPEGFLAMNGTVKVYVPRRAVPDLNTMTKHFEILAAEKLSNDLQYLSFKEISVKIIAGDNAQFSVSREILCVRSLYFKLMFQSDLKEAKTGEIRMDDLSGKTVNILLRYIFSGKLLPDWKSTDVLEELVYAAHKYELHELLAFLDQTLGLVCNKVNVKTLASLASKMGLTTAEKDLFEYVKRTATSVDDLKFLLENSKQT